MSGDLRVGFFGNIANNFYQLAKALRDHANVDAHLFLDANSDATMLPESDDRSLTGAYPSWIHSAAYLTPSAFLMPWNARIVRELRAFDLVVASATGPLFAQYTGRPWCFFVTGGDLTVAPFPLRNLYRYRTLRAKLGNLVVGLHQRRAIRQATQIWSQPFKPFEVALEQLHVGQSRVASDYFPLLLDVNRFRFTDTSDSPDGQLRAIRRDAQFLLFHPARLLIRNDPVMREAGQWKRSDLLIRAFARFSQETSVRAVLVMPDRTNSPDIGLAKAQIAELGIADRVSWLQPPRPGGFTRDELIPYYSAADAVSDDFGIGWFGYVTLEALAMERPVITFVDDLKMSSLYPWHPMLSARTEDEIVRWLHRLSDDREFRSGVGRRGREWVVEFHSHERVASRYASNMRAMLHGIAPTI